MMSFKLYTPYPILFGPSCQEEWDRRSMWLVWGTGKVHTAFWWGNRRERPLGRPRRRWENIKWIFKKWYGEAWTGMIWLRI